MLFILSVPSIYAWGTKKGPDKCNLTQPIAFQTWSDFKNQCGKSKEIMKNPTTQVPVNLGLTPTRLLSVDSEKHVRKNVIILGCKFNY